MRLATNRKVGEANFAARSASRLEGRTCEVLGHCGSNAQKHVLTVSLEPKFNIELKPDRGRVSDVGSLQMIVTNPPAYEI